LVADLLAGANAEGQRPALYQKLREKNPAPFKRLDALEVELGHQFQNRLLLYEAMTHRSAVGELASRLLRILAEAEQPAGEVQPKPAKRRRSVAVAPEVTLPWNERLEFLGDAVLGLVISAALIRRAEAYPEGTLSKIRASLVNEAALASVARKLGIGTCVFLGKGEARAGGRERDALLADTLEALLGAIYLDSGFEAAEQVVGRLFEDKLSGTLTPMLSGDFKTVLQELAQGLYKEVPAYKVTAETGPDHAKTFEVVVCVAGRTIGSGRGASKKRASQAAARDALMHLSKDGESAGAPA